MSVTIATLSGHPGVGENTGFIIVGFLFVIIVLSILSILTYLVGKLVQQVTKIQEAKTAAALASPSTSSPASPTSTSETPAKSAVPAQGSDEDIPAHILALIAAATHVVLDGRPQRIVGVRRIGNPNWAQEGRREIFSSHRIR